MIALPIDEALPALRQALLSRDEAVLEAPPGAGKTTRVPLALLGGPWLAGRSILMLEPRRLAARAAAQKALDDRAQEVRESLDRADGIDVGLLGLPGEIDGDPQLEAVFEGPRRNRHILDGGEFPAQAA